MHRVLARLGVVKLLARLGARRVSDGMRVADAGQTTAEYALVILGAAAIGTLLIAWATKSDAVGHLFDEVVGKILP